MAKSKGVSLESVWDLPPKDAVAYFSSKGYEVSDSWHDVWQDAHTRAFTVAKAMRLDVLTAIRKEVDNALAEGLTQSQFKQRLTPVLQKLGWWGKTQDEDGNEIQLGSPYRLNTIYRVNLQTAYMAGRHRRMLARADKRPYWQYIAIQDSLTRPSHSKLNGKVFRFDDPIWSVIYPPNGWNCRCRVRDLTAKQVEQRGLKVENGQGYIQPYQEEITHKATGEIELVDHARIKLPNGDSMTPDLGWAYSPGQATYGTEMAIAKKLGRVQDENLRAQTIQVLNNSPLRAEQFNRWAIDSIARIERFQQAKRDKFVEGLKANGPRPGHQTIVHFLPEAIYLKLKAKDKEAARVVVLTERSLAHAHSEKHQQSGSTLSLIEYQNLFGLMNDINTQILFEPSRKEVLYIVRKDSESIKIVVRFESKYGEQDTVINMFKVETQAIDQGIKGGLYELWR